MRRIGGMLWAGMDELGTLAGDTPAGEQCSGSVVMRCLLCVVSCLLSVVCCLQFLGCLRSPNIVFEPVGSGSCQGCRTQTMCLIIYSHMV